MSRPGCFPLAGPLFHDRYRTVPETRIVDMLLLAGWAYAPDRSDAAREALRRWVELGLPCLISSAGGRLFDPVEVWTAMKRLGRDGRDRYFHDRHVSTGRRLVNDLARSATPDGPFIIEFRRTFDLSGTPPRRSVRLRLPIPLEDGHPHRSVTIVGDAAGAVSLHANRIERRAAPSDVAPTLAARFAFSAPCRGTTAGDLDIFLRPREGAVVVSARVHALARKLAGPGSTVAQAVRAFWMFLIEGFVCTPIHYDQIDPAAPCDWVLGSGCYDCRLGAALFVALCRARDIPARLVGGHLLYRRAPTNHFWAEYWCREDGWMPVDFLSWDLSSGGNDPVWRDRFFGQVDARLVTEILPLAFTGVPGVPIPRAWHMLQTARDDGVEIALTALDGRPVYTDLVRRLD